MKNEFFIHICITQCTSKVEVLKKLADKLAENLQQIRAQEIFEEMLAREMISDTALEKGLALPHFIHEDNKVQLCIVTLANEIHDWNCLDGSKVKLLLCLIIPKEYDEQTEGIAQLVKVMQKLADSEFVATLIDAPSKVIEEKLT